MDCKQGTRLILDQMEEVLRVLDAGTYSRPLEVFNGSTLGQHFRHILDFYHCIFQGLPGQEIDYARRERNPVMETKPEAVMDAFSLIRSRLDDLNEGEEIRVWGDFLPLPGVPRPHVVSTLGRELLFAHDHAVHHLALIRIGLKACRPELGEFESLGVAPATLIYKANQGQTLETAAQ